MSARVRLGLAALVLGWIVGNAAAFAFAPRRAPPVTASHADEPATPGTAPPAWGEDLVERLFPPVPLVGSAAMGLAPPHDPKPAIEWLVQSEASLARARDPARAAFARWIGEALARPGALRARGAADSLDGEELSRGWQAAAERALWPRRLAVWAESLWLAADVAAPVELAACDGQGRLAARAPLTISGRELVAGWTRLALDPARTLLYPPRRSRAVRLWVLATRAGRIETVGWIALDAAAGGGTSEVHDPRDGSRRGVAVLTWSWVDPE